MKEPTERISQGSKRSGAAPAISAFAIGLVINPKGVRQAFIRGRQRSNLYDLDYRDHLLSQKAGHLRQQLSLDQEVDPASFIDAAAFLCWAAVGIMTLSTIIIFVLSPLALLLAFAGILLA
jgi:hypothetical protein